MSQRALIRAGDLNRLLKAAKEHGFAVEFEGDKVRLLPSEGGAQLPSPEQADNAWERGLAKWRRSA